MSKPVGSSRQNGQGIMIGLEIHFQLRGTKLFCGCSTETYGVRGESFERRLSPTVSEMGVFDPAAEYEKKRDRTFSYLPTDNSCLVEADEEPPHKPNMNAVETGMMIANALGCRIVDSVTFMRKMVVDGSNTSGFQRSAVVGFHGKIETSKGPVRISSVCVEEDSARKMEQENSRSGAVVPYSLDRLGIPLIEVATDPDIKDAEHAVEVARLIGYVVASTGKARRQVDSIRQDVNVSLGFGRVEVKGIQKLSLIGESISYEVERQTNVSKAVSVFKERGGMTEHLNFVDVKNSFRGTSSKMLKSAFKRNESIFCTRFPNVSGLLKNSSFRLGKDFSDIAKAFGLGGILHTDELPAFGITEGEVESVREIMKPRKDDALVFIVAREQMAQRIAEALESRIEKLCSLDFSETRGPSDDGSTKFLRPLPGKERMYPETDVPLVHISREILERVRGYVPKTEEEVAKQLSKDYSISLQEARTLASNFMVEDFTGYAEALGEGSLSARMLLQTVPEIEKKYGVKLDASDLAEIFRISRSKDWPRTLLEEAIDLLASGRRSPSEVARKLEAQIMSEDELKALVIEICEEMGKSIKAGSLIATLKERSNKSFDPKKAIEFFTKL